jgi:hypothetical protein
MALDLNGNLVDQPTYFYKETLYAHYNKIKYTIEIFLSNEDAVKIKHNYPMNKNKYTEVISIKKYKELKNKLSLKEKITNFKKRI